MYMIELLMMLYVGSFDNIPAYDPLVISCTDVTTSTLFTSTQSTKTSTASETSTGIISWTTTPVQTITSHVQSPSPTPSGGSGDEARDEFTIGMAVGVSVATAIFSMIITIMIICCVLRRLVHLCVAHTLRCCFIILYLPQMKCGD